MLLRKSLHTSTNSKFRIQNPSSLTSYPSPSLTPTLTLTLTLTYTHTYTHTHTHTYTSTHTHTHTHTHNTFFQCQMLRHDPFDSPNKIKLYRAEIESCYKNDNMSCMKLISIEKFNDRT